MGKCKVFVIDTNVILHDHECIYNFDDNDVVIPITVLEELDKFKRGNDQLNFQARQFVRVLDEIVGSELFNGGISLGQGKGKLTIETGKPFSDKLKESFREDIPDHRILAITEFIRDRFKDRKVVLVTKDVNLRMKAKSLQIESEDYKNDKVSDINVLYLGIREYKDYDDNLIAKLYENSFLTIEESGIDKPRFLMNFSFLKAQGPAFLLIIILFTSDWNGLIKRLLTVLNPGMQNRLFQSMPFWSRILNWSA